MRREARGARRGREQMASKVGPWFSKTRWGKWSDRINVSIVVALLLFMLWKSFF